MNKGLEALKRMGKKVLYSEYAEYPKVKELADYKTVEKELIALKAIISMFDIKIVGDYLMAQRGDTCVIYNLKIYQSQEITCLLKEVLL